MLNFTGEMERNLPTDQNRSPPPPPSDGIHFFTAATQHLHPFYQYHQPPPQLPPLRPQGFLPFYQPSRIAPLLSPQPVLLHGGATVDPAPSMPQFFIGGGRSEESSRGGGNGPPWRMEEVNGLAPAPAAAAGLTVQRQQESGKPFGKPFTEENHGKVGAQPEQQVDSRSFESWKAALMGELEAMCKNGASAAFPASVTPHEINAGRGSDSEEEGIKEEDAAAIAKYTEIAVKHLMAHQQTLHGKCMEKLKKIDRERRARDEEWRQVEAEMIYQMATFRERDKADVEEREAIIVSYLEMITGQTIQLPPQISSGGTSFSYRRWPDGEVDKLIEIRASLEPRFHRSSCKFSLWEEVSGLMVAAGYQRTAMRCKEKWENINKYFKRLKRSSSPNKPHKRAKTCQYYEKLDHLYSRSSSGCTTSGVNDNDGINRAGVDAPAAIEAVGGGDHMEDEDVDVDVDVEDERKDE